MKNETNNEFYLAKLILVIINLSPYLSPIFHIVYSNYQWNRPQNVTLPNGDTRAYTYDYMMRTGSIDARDSSSSTIMSRAYQYSLEGNVHEKSTEHGLYSYNYDEMYRLTSATNPTHNNESYSYDDLGNRLTAADVSGDWLYNQNNELEGYGSFSFDYDENGNMTRKSLGSDDETYSYDTDNRLVTVKDDSLSIIAEYSYDPFGRRLWKDVGGVRTYFLYSDEGLIGEYDSSGNEVKAYGYKPGSQWTTDPIFVKISGVYYYYHNDHLGTPQKITDSSGSVVWAATYDSFGNAQITIETITNNLRFPGQYYDAETGLHYNWHRYYNPAIGRYLRVDPAGDGLNLYVYVYNNPLGLIDPRGLTAATYANQSLYWSDDYKADHQFELALIGLHNQTWQGSQYSRPTNVTQCHANVLEPQPAAQQFLFDTTTDFIPGKDYAELVGSTGPAFVNNPGLGRGLSATANIIGMVAVVGDIAKQPIKWFGNTLQKADNVPIPDTLYHYTLPENVAGILDVGLQPGAGSGKIFTTPTGSYSPIEAQMYLGLSPNRGLSSSLLEIDNNVLRSMGITPSEGPMRVLPTPNAMGSGQEIIFEQAIPPSAIKQVR